MRVAILGGTRFIGPFIVRKLVAQGHEVAVYHRGKTSAELPEGVRSVIIDRDIPGSTAEALTRERPSAVIDMCGYHPEQLEEIIRAPLDLAHYVFCGTTAVYGRIFKATPDELSATKPKSEYEIGKVACEALLLQAQLEVGFPVTILRLAHPYGPLDELIYSNGRESHFLDRMRKGRPIIIPSGGDTRVHPVYVEDAANAFVYAMGRDDCMGRVFNLAGDEILTHDEYFESIARVLGVPLVAEHIPGEWFETHTHLWEGKPRGFGFSAAWYKYESGFDNSRLKSVGFHYNTDHDTGVAKNVAWLDEKSMIPESSNHDIEDLIIAEWKSGK